jgi:hypothetical protein
MSQLGQKHVLPRRSIAVRSTPISRPRQNGFNATAMCHNRTNAVQQTTIIRSPRANGHAASAECRILAPWPVTNTCSCNPISSSIRLNAWAVSQSVNQGRSPNRRSTTMRAHSNLVHLFHKSPRLPQHVRNLAPPGDCFSRIVSVLEGILVTLRSAWGHPAMHSASAVRHRCRPAPAPAPCLGSASRAAVHGQFASHGVVPLISLHPLPPGPRPRRPQPGPQHAHGRARP